MGKLEFSPLGPEKNRSAHSSAASTAALAPVHVVLVGGDLLFRAGLKRLFENSALKLTAEADSLADLEATASLQTQPQVLIAVDPEWPDTNSEVWREQFQRLWPDAHLIALITGNDEKAAAAALRNGLDGCLFADMAPPVLVHAIQLVAMGANVFPTRVGRNFVQNAVQSNRPDLTPRERDILQRLQAGYSNKMIAN